MVLGKRKRYSTSRRTTAKRRRTSRVRRPLMSNDMHQFKRVSQLVDISSITLAPNPGAMSLSMSLLPGISDFTTLYDQYRINKVKLSFVPEYSSLGPVDQTAAYPMPNLHTAIDLDDSAFTGPLTELMQYPGYKRTRGNATHSRYWTPSVSTEVFRSAVTTSYAPKTRQWLDFAVADVPHYGLKYFVDPGPASGTQWTWQVYLTIYFTCKGVR